MLCNKCKADVLVPEIPKELKEKTAATYRGGKRLQAAMDLHNAAGIDLGNCKLIIFHLTPEYGKCNRCVNQLNKQEAEQICSKCKALNFNW